MSLGAGARSDSWEDGLETSNDDIGVARGPKSGRRPNPGRQTKYENVVRSNSKKILKDLQRKEPKVKVTRDAKTVF